MNHTHPNAIGTDAIRFATSGVNINIRMHPHIKPHAVCNRRTVGGISRIIWVPVSLRPAATQPCERIHHQTTSPPPSTSTTRSNDPHHQSIPIPSKAYHLTTTNTSRTAAPHCLTRVMFLMTILRCTRSVTAFVCN